MDLVPGTQLGQYRIVEQVGRGGMATVFKAFQPALDRYVAVKVLPAFYAEDPSFLERFRQEARTVSQLRHPNVLSVFDFGEQDGVTYMVSEFLPGGTLEQFLGQPLSLARSTELLKPIAAALDYAHSRGMIHRDVKPSNILMTEDDEPVLTDFGVARIVAGTNRLTTTGTAVGTPEYMAPEQATGDPTTPASDRYALGIVLYEMLTGRTPFQAETPVAVALAHLHKPLPLPRTLNPSLPEAAETLLLKALAKDPAERFESARAMIDALEESTPTVQFATDQVETISTAGPTAVGPGAAGAAAALTAAQSDPVHPSDSPAAPVGATLADLPAQPLPAWRGRRPTLAILAGLIGLLAVIGVGVYFFMSRQSRPAVAEKPTSSAVKASPAQAAGPGPAVPTAPPPAAAAPAPTAPQAAAAAPTAGSGAIPKAPLAKPERLALERLLPQFAARFGAVERDDFSNPANALFAVPPNLSSGRIAYENGSLVLEVSRKSPSEPGVVATYASRPSSFTNGVVDVEARLNSGPEMTLLGLPFRRAVNSAEGYYVLVNPRRKLLVLQKQVGSERIEVGRAQVEVMLPEANNRITVVADGPDLQIHINGQSALTAKDDSFTAGQVGLSLGLGAQTNLGDAHATFDDFRVVSLK